MEDILKNDAVAGIMQVYIGIIQSRETKIVSNIIWIAFRYPVP